MSPSDAPPRPLSRRGFLAASAAAGGGLMMGLSLPEAHAAQAPPEINAWIVVRPDDTVVVRISKAEMGQGTLTGLAQLAAEELDCDWARVTTEHPTPGQSLARDRPWGAFLTADSRGLRGSQEAMRKGGAAARAMLVQAAADAWKARPGDCAVAKGVITHLPTGRTTTFGKVATAAARLAPPAEVALKDPKDWTIAGKPLPRLDTRPKLDGRQVYSIDVRLPGMLNAAIRMTPTFGGRLKGFTAGPVERMPGVRKVVRVGDAAVAVVADTWWRAKTALEALEIDWDPGPHAGLSSADIDQTLVEALTASDAFVGTRKGDVPAALAAAATRVEAVYSFPYQHHATLEPMNATALWTPDGCQVWTSTQNAEAALATVAAAAGLPVEACEVHGLQLGGGFGRRASSHDYVEQAVLIARQTPGVPVKLIWSREEDMLHGRYHPVSKARLVGALDAAGELTGLHMRIAGQSILAGFNPAAVQRAGGDRMVFQGLAADGAEGVFGYTVPNLLIDHVMRNTPAPPGFWRGVNNNQNALYLECFIDELAAAAGQDPLAFRRKLMANHPRHLAVLNAVAERAWGKSAVPGAAQGLCQHMGYGSYVAAVADVTVDRDGNVRVHRIVAATNPGQVVNPQQVEAQIEGSFAFGLTAALQGEITLAGGRVEQENFDSFPILRLADMPAVESIVMPSGGFWGGVGEPTIFVAAPAVLNAVSRAIGRRVRQIPLGKLDLKAV